MTPDKPRFEVWRETVQGVWSLAHEEDGTQHFTDRVRAEKLLDTLLDEGMLRQAVLVSLIPVRAINCAGAVVAKRMGLVGKNVIVEGGFKVQMGPRRTIK